MINTRNFVITKYISENSALLKFCDNILLKLLILLSWLISIEIRESKPKNADVNGKTTQCARGECAVQDVRVTLTRSGLGAAARGEHWALAEHRYFRNKCCFAKRGQSRGPARHLASPAVATRFATKYAQAAGLFSKCQRDTNAHLRSLVTKNLLVFNGVWNSPANPHLWPAWWATRIEPTLPYFDRRPVPCSGKERKALRDATTNSTLSRYEISSSSGKTNVLLGELHGDSYNDLHLMILWCPPFRAFSCF